MFLDSCSRHNNVHAISPRVRRSIGRRTDSKISLFVVPTGPRLASRTSQRIFAIGTTASFSVKKKKINFGFQKKTWHFDSSVTQSACASACAFFAFFDFFAVFRFFEFILLKNFFLIF